MVIEQNFTISELSAGGGVFGICPIPGRFGTFDQDMMTLLNWRPDLVLTLTMSAEMAAEGAQTMASLLGAQGIAHVQLPIVDFSTPDADVLEKWPTLSQRCRGILAEGGRVIAHCRGGCGRSGMAVLRLMIELGEPADQAFERLRACRACAVETEAQRKWAFIEN